MTILGHPILKVLEKLEKRRASGIFELHNAVEDDRIYIYLYDGLIEAAASSRNRDRLGQYLIRAQVIDQEKLDRLLKKNRKEGRPLGEVLVEQGILSPGQLSCALTRQLIDRIGLVIEKDYKAGGFTASTKGSMKYRLKISSFQLALEMARSRPLELELAPSQAVELVGDGDSKAAFWTPEEVSVLSHLRAPATLDLLGETTNLDESSLLATLQVFLDLGMLRVIEGPLTEQKALVIRERLPLHLLVPAIPNAAPEEKIRMANQEHSIINEQFRALKVRLGSQVEPPVSVFSVTSPGPQDGKSLVSTNLALNFSREPGRRVLLIDADLRGASVHEKLGIGLGPGLFQYLLEGLEPQCYLRRVGNLYVMTGGEFADDAVELLSLSRMKKLIEFGKSEFDTVVVDAPPLLPIADARLVNELTQATLLVIYQGQTPYRLIERALESVDKRKLLGVILNGVRTTGLNGYYTHGYYYSSYPRYSDRKSSGDVIEVRARPRDHWKRRSGRMIFDD